MGRRPARLVVVRPVPAANCWEVDHPGLPGDKVRRHRHRFATEVEATEYAAQMAARLSVSGAVGPEQASPLAQVSVADYVQHFLAERASELEARTLAGYRYHLSGMVTEVLGRVRVADLTRRHVVALKANMSARTYKRGGQDRPYSPTMLRLARASLSAMCSAAVDAEILKANPCIGFRSRTRREKGAQAAAAEMRPLAQHELVMVLAAAGPEEALYAMMGRAGLRPGEALALHVADLDLDGRTVLVQRTLDLDGSVKPTKTGTVRTVQLSAALVRTLRPHVARLKAKALRAGTGTPVWLFPGADGEPLDSTRLPKLFKAALGVAGVSLHHRPYDLRHTYATLMLAKGAPLTFVSAQLGHSNPATTLRHYSRWIPGTGAEWADMLETVSGKSGTARAVGASDVSVESSERRGSSVAEQLIRNQ